MAEKTSRGLRNCNPGNIRRSETVYRGEKRPSEDGEFKQFVSMAWGYRAMFVILECYRHRYGLTTLREMLGRYAPPTENSTEMYVEFVARKAGVSPEERLDTASDKVMKAVVAAMSQMENGAEATMEDVEEGWRLFAESRHGQ